MVFASDKTIVSVPVLSSNLKSLDEDPRRKLRVDEASQSQDQYTPMKMPLGEGNKGQLRKENSMFCKDKDDMRVVKKAPVSHQISQWNQGHSQNEKSMPYKGAELGCRVKNAPQKIHNREIKKGAVGGE